MPPTLGRIVLFCIARNDDGSPVLRPADVVNDWGGSDPNINILVKLDGFNDARHYEVAVAELRAFDEAHPGVTTGEPFGDEASVAKRSDLSRTTSAAPTPAECSARLAWRTSVAEGTDIGTWRWPPRA